MRSAISTATVSLALRDSPLVAGSTRDRIKEQRPRHRLYLQPPRRQPAHFALGHCRCRRARQDYEPVLRRDPALDRKQSLDRSRRQTFILSNHYDQLEKQRTFIDTLLQLGADGVIMSPAIGTPASDIVMAEENGLPAVLIARTVEGADVPVFRGDDSYGTGLATNHLISLGHKRIAMIGGTDQTSTGRVRYQGYVNAMEAAGLEVRPSLSIDGPRT